MRLPGLLIVSLMLTRVVFAQNAGEAVKVYRATVDADGVQRIEVTGGEYFFDPNYIVVKKDIPVELTVSKKPGIVPHDIVINSPDAGMQIKEDLDTEKQVLKFTPTKAGKYPFYCDKKLLFFKSHQEKGMEGFIEVVE